MLISVSMLSRGQSSSASSLRFLFLLGLFHSLLGLIFFQRFPL